MRICGEEDGDLGSRIAAAAYAAEDVIETHIVDQIRAGSTSHGENISSVDLYGGLERVIHDMDLIKRETMRAQQFDLHRISSVPPASTRQSSSKPSNITPVFDEAMVNQVLDKLTGQQSGLQIIPIVGMGGIGILKPTKDKRLEEVAEENIKEIIDRNLIIVEELRWNGKAKTLKIVNPLSRECKMASSDIWEMPLLRHVAINGLELSYPICGENDLILEDLQSLSRVMNFKCSEAVIKRIPNIKKLKIKYQMSGGEEEYHNFGLNNIGHLKELQHFSLSIGPTAILDREIYQCHLTQNLIFPHSLEKLTLCGTMLDWEECMKKIGYLPLLQYLRLYPNACFGPVWETVDGQFCSLRILKIHPCGLRYWRTEDTHFPRLELLDLINLHVLEEIPSCIGDIPTLKSIRLDGCSKSIEDSARVIKEEQLEFGNTDLQLLISGVS
ncbi:hypothetical protein ACS0TY_000178 [Phlomoides rotata]